MTRRLRLLGTGLVRLGEPLPPDVAAEGHLLSRCAAAGVRLPVGAVLLDGGSGGGPHGLGPFWSGEHVLLRALGTSFAVRVGTDDEAGLTAALSTFRLATPTGSRCDVLVLRAVAAVHAGRAQVCAARPYDVVEAVEGEAHELDGGEVRTLLVPRLTKSRQRPHRGGDPWRTPLPPWAMRLSRLLRDVGGALGPGDRDLVWADDGQVCRLLGVTRENA